MFEIGISDPFYEIKSKALSALYEVKDPELGVNIVDLGMVYNLEVRNAFIVLYMTLSTPSCPMGGFIVSYAKIAIEKALQDYEADIRLVWEPKWNYEFISTEGRTALGL